MILKPEGRHDIPTFANCSDAEFENLILDLIRAENPSAEARRLGPGPIKQHGYDIEIVLPDATKICCECKGRTDAFGRKELTDVVKTFLRGDRVSWADEFWVITSGIYSRTSEQAKREAEVACKERGIKFKYVWRENLWARLIDHPPIVNKYLGEPWWRMSLSWCQARISESREQDRRNQKARESSGESIHSYDDGYISLTFLLPSANEPWISALIVFKTDGLERALITLNNDDVLDAFDEPMWRSEKPLLVAEHANRAWAQFGNVRVELDAEMFAKLARHLRSVCKRWLEKVCTRDRELEAEGYQSVAEDRVKLGQIRTDMWRCMIHFANEHDVEHGDSRWHIFDRSPAQVKVYTNIQTAEMDSGYHLILSTRPHVTESTGDGENVDLIWHAPVAVIQGSSARGKRGPWGCETAVNWLREKLIPHLINLYWPTKDSHSLTNRIRRRSGKASRGPQVADFFYVQKATDWSIRPIRDRASLCAMLSSLQHHYSCRCGAKYPNTYSEATDKALLLVLRSASNPDWKYIASNAELGSGECKEDLLRRLAERLTRPYLDSNGLVLDFRLRAILFTIGEDDYRGLNSSEYEVVAEILRPLAVSAALYNHLLAHKSSVSNVYPL